MSFEISVEEIEELIETGNLNIDHALKELGATSQPSLNKPPSQSSRTEGNDGGTKISRNPAPVEAPAHTSTAQRSHNEENESGKQNLDSLSMISNKPQTGTLLMGSDIQLPIPSKTYQGLILDAKKRALNEPRRDQKITNEHGSMNDTRIFKRGENIDTRKEAWVTQNQRSRTQPSLQDIEESTRFHGLTEEPQYPSGAIHAAHQSNQLPLSKNAHVEDVPKFANYASEILDAIKALEVRLDRIEGKVDKIMLTQNTIQQTKNDTQQIKGSLATIEGLITTMKIMDPGVPSKVSLRSLNKESEQVPIIVTGNGDVSKFVDQDNTITLDSLARPILSGTKQKTDERRAGVRIDALKITVSEMIRDLFGDCDKSKKLLESINMATTEQDINLIKTNALRSIT
nr:phosphoprotein [Human parainfluenza virus 4a]